MTLKEITALALAGYKKKDIDAMIAEENDPEPEPTPEPEPEPDAGNDQKDDAKNEPEPDDQGGDDSIKTELEKLRAELAETQKKLTAAQKDNVKKNNDSHTDEAAEREKRMTDYARKMM